MVEKRLGSQLQYDDHLNKCEKERKNNGKGTEKKRLKWKKTVVKEAIKKL